MEEIAVKIIRKAFADKTDKAGKPYIDHLTRVANKVPDYGSPFHELKIIALLHDVLEDCPEWTEKALRTFFTDRIVDRVVILTKSKFEPYEDYIERVTKDNWACLVKKADLEDNMDLTRLPEITQKDIDRVKKYHKAYQRVVAAL